MEPIILVLQEQTEGYGLSQVVLHVLLFWLQQHLALAMLLLSLSC